MADPADLASLPAATASRASPSPSPLDSLVSLVPPESPRLMAVDGHLGLNTFVLDSSIGRPPSPTSPTSPTSPAQTPRVQVVCLESIIGVGKSTQMARLKEVYADDPTVAFVDEPDDAWRTFGLLDAFYEKKVGAAVFQLVALATISARLSTALASGATTKLVTAALWSNLPT